MSQATITMPASEWQELQDAKRSLEAKVTEVTKLLDEARLDKGTGDARKLADALTALMEVVQFSVAHLEPRMFRGWPHEALRAFATLLPDLPGIDPSLAECANDWHLFCDDAQRWEEARKDGKQFDLLAEENAVRGMSVPDAHGKMGATILDTAEAAGAAKLLIKP